MSTTEIRDALHEIGTVVTAPPVDRLAFQREVRRQRRSRAAARTALVGCAAAALLVGVVAMRPDGTVRDLSPTGPAPARSGAERGAAARPRR